jgi:hypothetical protein
MVGRRALLILMLAIGFSARSVVAQDATPSTIRDRLDLAAMTLDGADLPSGYSYVFESYVPADQAASQLTDGAVSEEDLAATGFRWFYQSTYATADRVTSIRTYVEEYRDEAGARAGFALLEDETRVLPEADFEDFPASGIGEEPSEVSVGTLEAPNGEETRHTVDATFRIDRLLAGVAIETTGTEPPDRRMAEDLAARLAERVEIVLDGDAPEGIDLELPRLMLPVTDLTPSTVEGYLTSAERLGAVDPATGAVDAFGGSYLMTAILGDQSSDTPGPFITLSLTSFASADVALAVLDQADQLPVIATGEPVEGLRVPNADAAKGFRFAFGSGTSPDSFRIVFVVDATLAVVEVWASASSQAETLDLSVQQATCLSAEPPCDTVRLPASLFAQTR